MGATKVIVKIVLIILLVVFGLQIANPLLVDNMLAYAQIEAGSTLYEMMYAGYGAMQPLVSWLCYILGGCLLASVGKEIYRRFRYGAN